MNGLYNPSLSPTLNGIKSNAKANPMGSWTLEEDRDYETLCVRKNNKILFRFLHEPYNVFARISTFTISQNGNYTFEKSTT